MMMNAGAGFWHEEKVKEDEVEMLQIFVRPNETDLSPEIQFHDKPDRQPRLVCHGRSRRK